MLLSAASFLAIPFVYGKIKNHEKKTVLILFLFCTGIGFLVVEPISYYHPRFNNLMIFIGIPGSGIENNKEIKVVDIKQGNRIFDLNDFQFSKGCSQAGNPSIICGGLSLIEYVYEIHDETILPIKILILDQTRNEYKTFTLNVTDNFVSLNNVYQNQSISFMVLWISYGLMMLMLGFSLSISVFCLSLFFKWDLLTTIITIVITLIYIWLSTGGTMYEFFPTTYYYDYLTDAFLHGQPHLLIEPAKELLALPDPYDPQANEKWRLHDASLYQGKYYLYWGPAPALLLLLFKYIFPGFMIGDQLLVVGFVIGIFFFMMKFILIITRDLFKNIPEWVIFIGALVMGLAISQTWLLGRPFIYEAAISAGQFFLLAGLLCAYYAFEKKNQKEALLVLAGICWALAVSSRATQAVAVVFLFLLTTWRIMRTPDKKYILDWKSLLALSLPLVTGMFLLAWYNYVRFGSVLEFGMTYALSGNRNDDAFRLDHLIPSLYFYFVRVSSIKLESHFPFLDTMFAQSEIISLPKSYVAHVDTIGLLWVFPFIWILPVSIVFGYYFRKSNPFIIKDAIGKSKLIWFGLCLIGASTALLPQLLFLGTPMRYFADFLPGVALLTFFVFCFVYTNLESYSKALYSFLIIFLSLSFASVIFGFLLGINSEIGFTLFSDNNPALFKWLVENIHF